MDVDKGPSAASRKRVAEIPAPQSDVVAPTPAPQVGLLTEPELFAALAASTEPNAVLKVAANFESISKLASSYYPSRTDTSEERAAKIARYFAFHVRLLKVMFDVATAEERPALAAIVSEILAKRPNTWAKLAQSAGVEPAALMGLLNPPRSAARVGIPIEHVPYPFIDTAFDTAKTTQDTKAKENDRDKGASVILYV